MVFKLLRSFLSPNIGTLYKNTHVILSHATVSLQDNLLTFTGSTTKSFPLPLTNMQVVPSTINSLSFTVHKDTYIFLTSQDLSFITKNEEIILSLKGTYSVFATETGTFNVEEKHASILIVKNNGTSFLRIKADGALLHEEEIDGLSTFRTQGGNRVIWSAKHGLNTFCLELKSRVEFLEFMSDMAFVSRGSSIGVYDIDRDATFLSSVDDLRFSDHLIEPEKILSHDDTMYILDKTDKKSIYKLNLDRGEVVETFAFTDHLQDVFTSGRELVSVTENGLYRVDCREGVVGSNVYKTNNHFRCGMSTEDGQVAVASSNGTLRLYDNLERRARMLLPGYGDTVLGVDRTDDGRFVLCTCQTYILLYDLTQGKTPRRLYIKPEHIAHMKEPISFNTANFSGDTHKIVAGTGHFIITWDVGDVLNGKLFDYHIKKYADHVVGERFVREDIVVALSDGIKVTKESGMRNPEKIARERRSKK